MIQKKKKDEKKKEDNGGIGRGEEQHREKQKDPGNGHHIDDHILQKIPPDEREEKQEKPPPLASHQDTAFLQHLSGGIVRVVHQNMKGEGIIQHAAENQNIGACHGEQDEPSLKRRVTDIPGDQWGDDRYEKKGQAPQQRQEQKKSPEGKNFFEDRASVKQVPVSGGLSAPQLDGVKAVSGLKQHQRRQSDEVHEKQEDRQGRGIGEPVQRRNG